MSHTYSFDNNNNLIILIALGGARTVKISLGCFDDALSRIAVCTVLSQRNGSFHSPVHDGGKSVAFLDGNLVVSFGNAENVCTIEYPVGDLPFVHA
jgi:hypothetical protein